MDAPAAGEPKPLCGAGDGFCLLQTEADNLFGVNNAHVRQASVAGRMTTSSDGEYRVRLVVPALIAVGDHGVISSSR